MAKRLEWGIAIPQDFADEPVDMKLIHQYSKRAEELCFQSMWIQEAILGDAPVDFPRRDALALAGPSGQAVQALESFMPR